MAVLKLHKNWEENIKKIPPEARRGLQERKGATSIRSITKGILSLISSAKSSRLEGDYLIFEV